MGEAESEQEADYFYAILSYDSKVVQRFCVHSLICNGIHLIPPG